MLLLFSRAPVFAGRSAPGDAPDDGEVVSCQKLTAEKRGTLKSTASCIVCGELLKRTVYSNVTFNLFLQKKMKMHIYCDRFRKPQYDVNY